MKIVFEPNAANRAQCQPGSCVGVKRRLGELGVYGWWNVTELEARVGIEPTNKGFADLYVQPPNLLMLLGVVVAETLPCPPLARLHSGDRGATTTGYRALEARTADDLKQAAIEEGQWSEKANTTPPGQCVARKMG